MDSSSPQSKIRSDSGLRGAMDEIISDRAQAEISNDVQQVLRAYLIKDGLSHIRRTRTMQSGVTKT